METESDPFAVSVLHFLVMKHSLYLIILVNIHDDGSAR